MYLKMDGRDQVTIDHDDMQELAAALGIKLQSLKNELRQCNDRNTLWVQRISGDRRWIRITTLGLSMVGG